MREFFQHFAFENPWWLLILLLLPPLCFLRNTGGSLAGINLSSLRIVSSVGTPVREIHGSFTPLLLLLALLCCGLAMARPQWRQIAANSSASGIDILIALDVSGRTIP